MNDIYHTLRQGKVALILTEIEKVLVTLDLGNHTVTMTIGQLFLIVKSQIVDKSTICG